MTTPTMRDLDFWPQVVLSLWPFAGAPSSGVWPTGWVGIDNTGTLYVCSAGGSPGTWAQVGSAQAAAALAGPKIGLYGATPVVQAAAITPPSGGSVIDVQARAAVASILNALGAAAGGIGVTA